MTVSESRKRLTGKRRYRRVTGWAFSATLLTGCYALPSQEGRVPSVHISPDTPSALQKIYAPEAEKHPGKSGIYPLDDGREAFVARAALIRAAERSLDVQYYIWRNDTSGQMLFHEIAEAADRGVRVRFLLDDNNTSGMDDVLSALNRHPNIQVRLFNPFMNRRIRALGYLTDFSRLNRRMHNKSLTADSLATIVGGRNVGDEYFDFGSGLMFVDLDALAVGPAAAEVAENFDRYWNSVSAYPLEDIVRRDKHKVEADSTVYNARRYNLEKAEDYGEAVREDDFGDKLLHNRLPLEWAGTQLVSDDPMKAAPPEQRLKRQSRTEKNRTILANLMEVLQYPEEDMLLISPYFVPTKAGVEALSHLHQDGVHITVLTNSLSAGDIPAVHSGYARYRRRLLEAGISLYELKNQDLQKGRRDRGITGSSASSLHAKTFTVDGERMFIGSLNLDPRSALLNTEMGLVIRSPSMARDMNRTVRGALPQLSYQVYLDEKNKMRWRTRDGQGNETVYSSEPEAGFWRKVLVRVLSVVPIEGLL